jgi:hypothetical protein
MKFASSRRLFYLKQILLRATFAIGFLLSASVFVAAQGDIKGKVVADIPDQRKALTGVVVSLSGERLSGKQLQSISDEEGRYDFPRLVAGDYKLSVALAGFKSYEQKISVQIDATVEHNILLKPEAVSVTVTVKQDPRML